jgi:hypothetical protein
MQFTRPGAFAWAIAALIAAAPASAATAPAPLSAAPWHSNIASAYGSGSFGSWTVDRFGLPAYEYALDEQTAPQAKERELNGATDGHHQVGNDHIVADAFNHGYVQLWTQDRDYSWLNYYDASADQFAGGYGYLNVGGKVISTLYGDRPAGAQTERVFGPGYFRTGVASDGLKVTQYVYAPFGDDAVLLHDVTITNTSAAPIRASWFEYWGVNPWDPGPQIHRPLAPASYDAGTHTLSVAQVPAGPDTNPESIYLAALQAPVAGYDTSTQAFFGSGTRARPAAVAANSSSDSTALPQAPTSASQTLLSFRSPVSIPAGRSVTLRYAYGFGHPADIGPVVSRYRAAKDPLTSSERAWRRWLPQSSFGPGYGWLSRELQWDAYMVRSGATYEECAGHHVISQGGYYQYGNGLGFQGSFRDPLQHLLPMIYADPYLAREVLLYSAGEQPAGTGAVPYARLQFCLREDLGTSDDLDQWLLLAASEYVLATRDFDFLNQQVPYANGGSGTVWQHLKLAYFHQEQIIGHGPHGGYVTGATGDWSDFATEYLQMTESMLVTAQAAYIYPLLATVADAHGDPAFADQLRASGSQNLATLRSQWAGRGWYARGYSGTRQLGSGAIFEEPQGWAMLAGAPSADEASTLVTNIRRFLDGIGAPAAIGGPAKIGSALVPADNDPDVTEHSTGNTGGVQNNADYQAGVWFAVNGWLAWGLSTLTDVLPQATDYAWSEFTRNTLAAHATAFPDAWDGVLSVDDMCWAFYSAQPDECGNGASSTYSTQVMHQPAWSLFDAIKLAGIEPARDGYTIDPHVPMRPFSLRLPLVGVSYEARRARGYLRPEADGRLTLRVRIPADVPASSALTWVDGRQVQHAVANGFATFTATTRAHRTTNWAVT